MIHITKEVTFVQDVDIDFELYDIEDKDLLEEIISRDRAMDLIEKLDEQVDSWDFTRKAYEYFAKKMERIALSSH